MYNLIVTAYRGESNFLLKQLNLKGVFKNTSFRDVLFGQVDDVEQFLTDISAEPPLSLARVMPVIKVVEFNDPEALLETLKKWVITNACFKKTESFKVTVERRGLKGELNSQVWARELGGLIEGSVDLENPDFELVFSIMNGTCGISLLSKSLKEEHYLVRAK